MDRELTRLQLDTKKPGSKHTFSFNNKYNYALTTIVGRRPTNEDAHIVSEACLAVMDGHGGSECSIAASKILQTCLQRYETGDVKTDLKLAVLELDKQLNDQKDAGCTLACVMMQNNKLYLLNCGDARIITEKHSTIDHKPTLEMEQARI